MTDVWRRGIRSLRWRLSQPFRPTRRRIVQTRYRGMDLLVLANEDIGWQLIACGEYERLELDILAQILREDDVCVDVGANVGIFSVFMARVAAKGRVLAFEPVPLARSMLYLNAALNNIENVEVLPFALSNESNQVVQFSVAQDTAYSSLLATNRVPEMRRIEARTATLDEHFARTNQKVDFVKVDVEGAELLVLTGGSQLLDNDQLQPRALLVELNPENQAAFGHSPDDVIRFMSNRGYKAHSITARGIMEGWPVEDGVENALFLLPSAQ